jgi:hypothetical protein
MSAMRRRVLLGALKFSDLMLMVCTFLLSCLVVLRQSRAVSFPQFLSMRIKLWLGPWCPYKPRRQSRMNLFYCTGHRHGCHERRNP